MGFVLGQPDGGGYVDLPGSRVNVIHTPNVSAFRIGQDLCHIFCIGPDGWERDLQTIWGFTWTPGTLCYLRPSGAVNYFTHYWYDTTTGLQRSISTPTFTRPAPGELKWFSLVLDVDNGAGGSTLRLYTSPSGVDGTWTIVGAPVTNGATPTTALSYGTTVPYVLGGYGPTNIGQQFPGKLRYYALHQGTGVGFTPGGNKVLEFDAREDLQGINLETSTVTSKSGHVWTVERQPNVEALSFPGPSSPGNYATVPDAANLDFTADVTMQFKIRPYDHSVASILAFKGSSANFGSVSYGARWVPATTAGKLQALFEASDGTMKSPDSADFLDWANREWFGFTLDADDGTGKYVCRFYDSIDGITWDLKRTVNGSAGITAVLRNTTDPVYIGGRAAAEWFTGDIEVVRVYGVIGAAGVMPAPTVTPILSLDRSATATSAASTQVLPYTGQTITVVRAGTLTTRLLMGTETTRLVSYGSLPVWVSEPVLRRPGWSVDLCKDWERIGIAENFQFTGTSRRNAMGDFLLDTSPAGVVGGVRTEEPSSEVEITDTFDQAGAPGGWTQVAGTWVNAGGSLDCTALDANFEAYIRTTAALSSADCYAEVDISVNADDAALILRWVDIDNHYLARYSAGKFQLFRVDGGFFVKLAEVTAASPEPYRMRFEAQGTTLRLFVDGVQVLTANDSDFTAAGSVAMRLALQTTTMFNNFEAGALIPGAEIPFDPRDVNTIRLVAEGRIVMPCYVGGPNGGRFIRKADANGERWSWSGVDAWWDLAGRLAFPVPTEDGPPWSASHDTRTGIASSVIAAYINANMGTGSLTARKHPGMIVTDQLVGDSDTWTARLQTLNDLTARIARDGEIEVIPEVGFDGRLRVLITSARDLSEFVVLSDQGDLLTSEASFIPRSASWTVSGGQGEGVARVFRHDDAGMTGSGRREQFSDVSGLASAAEVQRDATARNALAAESFAILSELTDVQAAIAITLGLRLGDKLSVIIDGVRYRVPIEAVQFDVGPARQSMKPLLGTATPDAFAVLLDRLDSLAPRFDNAIA